MTFTLEDKLFIGTGKCPQIFQRPCIHLQIRDARGLTRSKLHTEDPQGRMNLWTSLLHDASFSVHMYWSESFVRNEKM